MCDEPFSQWRSIYQSYEVPSCFIQGQIDLAEMADTIDANPILNTSDTYRLRWTGSVSFIYYED
jgi:hypothetical protein